MLASTFTSTFTGSKLSSSGFLAGQQVQQRATLRVQPFAPLTIEAAHKKGSGSTKNGRVSRALPAKLAHFTRIMSLWPRLWRSLQSAPHGGGPWTGLPLSPLETPVRHFYTSLAALSHLLSCTCRTLSPSAAV